MEKNSNWFYHLYSSNICCLCVWWFCFFGIQNFSLSFDLANIKGIFALFYSIFPENLFTPFIQYDFVKIICMFIVFGCFIIALEEKGKILITNSVLINDLFMAIMNGVSNFIPIVFFAFIV